MNTKQNLLIVTTDNDLSLNLFFSEGIQEYFNILAVGYDDDLIKIIGFSPDIIYFRDPFNTLIYDSQVVQKTINDICKQYPSVKYIDNIKRYDDILIEDKWKQYLVFKDVMPKTVIYSTQSDFIEGKNIIKKRISSRGKQIFFTRQTPLNDEYILQDQLTIIEEFRVYIVRGEIIHLVGVRTSKTPESKVKLIQCCPIPADVRLFVASLRSRLLQFDFIGLDIA